MKDVFFSYLNGFFEEFGYDEKISEPLRALYLQTVNGETQKEFFDIINYYNDNTDFEPQVIRERIFNLFSGKNKEDYPNYYKGLLLTFILMTRRMKENYKSVGNSEILWHESCLDLKYKLDECLAVKGCVGIFTDWFNLFLRLRIVKLGRLQFEKTYSGFELKNEKYDIKIKDKILSVHIPRTKTPLLIDEVMDSYQKAKDFFASYFDGGPVIAVCSSWLLFEKHKEFLSKTSNIVRFIDTFDMVWQREYDDYGEVWRLFDTEYKGDVSLLPKDSSLRMAYADLIEKGEKTGWGLGVRIL